MKFMMSASNELDNIDVECSVAYYGVWIPTFTCASGLRGYTVDVSSKSNHVRQKRVIAAAAIKRYSHAVLHCSTSFVLDENFRELSGVSNEPERPEYHFDWTSPPIPSGKLPGLYGRRQIKTIWGEQIP